MEAKHWCAGMSERLGVGEMIPAEFRDDKYFKVHGMLVQREELSSFKCQLNLLLRNTLEARDPL